jgi:hypothetical protein
MSDTYIDIEDPEQTLEGPEGLTLELSAKQIFPDDPGQGTPCLCCYLGQTGTYNCVSDQGAVDDEPLSGEQIAWINDIYSEVDEWLTYHVRRIREATQQVK